MKATTTWILIADGAHARLFANRGPGKGIEQIEVINGDDRPDSELVRDKLGRTHESVGVSRHAITPRVDPHRELKRAFAQHLGKVLDQGLSKDAYDRLVLVAPPAALGDLREVLSEPVKHKVYAELDKDLVKVPTKALPEHLGAVMPI
ncbi:host attachment protein [Hyphomicrobium sp. D-2]|uniref:host attachment protein n=1 Tax=Hyphomicrobium sp. D-2 TaxID=3041621 RepID=UPI002453D18F|nr:host attachment protein [Hyphomicrobium sp. D-2]MDH4981126.1 host attachment protein [Hyphomicrobium sp. D-2]